MSGGKLNTAIAGAGAGASVGAGTSVGGGWGAVAGGAAGFLLGSNDDSGKYYQQMLQEAKNIPLPILKEQYPDLYKEVVRLNPELETSVNLGPSATEGIATDPRYQQAQMAALNKMMNITENDGQDAQSKADAMRLENSVNANLQGNTGAIQQNMATRGLSGGMSELVAKQIAGQQAANRQAQSGMDINAMAQQRALSALASQGAMSSQMQNQDFNQQNTKAQSADAISRFNAQNQQQVISQNTQNKNQAQQWNAQNAQSTANSNTGVKNQAQQYNLGLAQQDFNNKLSKTGLGNAALGGMAQNQQQQARDQDQFLGSMFGAVAKYGASKNSGSKE